MFPVVMHNELFTVLIFCDTFTFLAGCVILNIIVVPGGQVYWTYSRGCGDDITFTVTVVVRDGDDVVTMPEFKPEDINDVGGLVQW